MTPLEDKYILEGRKFAKPTPLKRPSHLLIVDDCQGFDMYGMARRDLMKRMTIKHHKQEANARARGYRANYYADRRAARDLEIQAGCSQSIWR